MLAAHVAIAGLTVAAPADELPEPAFGPVDLQPAAPAPLPPEPPVPVTEADAEPAQAEPLADPAVIPDVQLPAPATEAAPAPVPSAEAAPADPAAPRELAALKGFSDPLEFLNRIFFAITQPIDRFIIRPAAMVYKTVVPGPARDGVRNVLRNLGEPIVFVNDLLQLRPDRAIRTLGRFLINTLLGLGGLFDVAKRKPINIPHHPNSLGNTLGYYGVGPLVYIYLPILGPTTLRDYAGSFGDGQYHGRLVDAVLRPRRNSDQVATGQADTSKLGTIITLLDGLDRRAENDAELKTLKADSVDFYASFRSNFLQDRAGEIAALKAEDGEAVVPDDFSDPLIDPEAAAPAVDASPPSATPEHAEPVAEAQP
jgi:phospholipid-binding lipoprotein MlaA